jgi:hypothetical protein
MVGGVLEDGLDDLPLIGHACRQLGAGPGTADDGDGQGDQNGNDADANADLDQ